MQRRKICIKVSMTLSYLQRHDEALQAADKYLDVAAKIYGDDGTDAFYLDALCDYAVILMNAGQYDKALEKVSYAIEKQTELEIGYPPINKKKNILADVYTASGSYEKADELLKELLADDPQDIDVLYSTAELKAAEGDIESALIYAEKCAGLTSGADPVSRQRRRCERLLAKLKNL